MKKTLLCLLIACCLLFSACPASAEDAGLLSVYAVDGESAEWLGNATQLLDGLALTSVGILPRESRTMVLTDGERKWDIAGMAYTCGGTAAFLFFDADGEDAFPAAWPIRKQTGLPGTEELFVLTGNENEDLMNRDVLNIAPMTFCDTACLLVRLSGPAALGSPVLTEDGELAGTLIAAYAEGLDRYVAVPSGTVGAMILKMVSEYTEDGKQHEADGYRLTAEGNRVTFDWSEAPDDEIPGEGSLYVIWRDTVNEFFYYTAAEKDRTSFETILVPGRTYYFGLCRASGKPVTFPDRYAAVTLEEAGKQTDYAFRPLKTCLALAPEEGLPDGMLPEPVGKVTEDQLRDGRVSFYTSSAYEVAGRIEDTLVVSMTLPDAENIFWTSGWVYMPEMMSDDTWSQPLGDMGFLELMESRGYPAGTYRIDFYIGGKLADTFTFDLD